MNGKMQISSQETIIGRKRESRRSHHRELSIQYIAKDSLQYSVKLPGEMSDLRVESPVQIAISYDIQVKNTSNDEEALFRLLITRINIVQSCGRLMGYGGLKDPNFRCMNDWLPFIDDYVFNNMERILNPPFKKCNEIVIPIDDLFPTT